MDSQQAFGVLAPRSVVDFCPSPLHVRRKSRRATIYKRLGRKPTLFRHHQSAYGPLDDIINEISCEICRIPSNTSSKRGASRGEGLLEDLLGWQSPLGRAHSCTVLPLPLSRIPSDLPLIVRKNRINRSSRSETSEDTMEVSGESSRKESGSTNETSFASSGNTESFPKFDSDQTATGSVSAADPTRTSHENRRRSSRKRIISRGLSFLRRPTIEDKEKPDIPPSTIREHEQDADPSDTVGKTLEHASGNFLSSFDARQLQIETMQQKQHNPELVSILKAGIRIIPEDKILKKDDVHDMWIAVEIEGLCHNRQRLEDESIDVVFLVDNSYYVGEDTLVAATEAISVAFNYLCRGDRVALYTTHCTHNPVSETRPDLLYPLRPFSDDSEDVIRAILPTMVEAKYQTWNPARPNPTMTDVVVAVGQSLVGAGYKADRTHMIILSPTIHALHKVSDSFPKLHIHQMTVGILPRLQPSTTQEVPCMEQCCERVSVNNWLHYQSIPLRLKHIIKDARSEKPIGDIINVRADIRTKEGCEVLEYLGSKDVDMDTLRLGQTFSFIVRVRVTPEDTEELNMESDDPLFQSSLPVTYWEEDLHNCKRAGAKIAHLLTVQLIYQSSLQANETWHYTEAQLLIMKDPGPLQLPFDTYMELQNRMLFYQFSRLDIADAKEEINRMIVRMEFDGHHKGPAAPHELRRRDQLQFLLNRMSCEIYRQGAVREYEQENRQRLTVYPPGPIRITAPHHSWLVDMWDAAWETRRRGGGY